MSISDLNQQWPDNSIIKPNNKQNGHRYGRVRGKWFERQGSILVNVFWPFTGTLEPIAINEIDTNYVYNGQSGLRI